MSELQLGKNLTKNNRKPPSLLPSESPLRKVERVKQFRQKYNDNNAHSPLARMAEKLNSP